MDWKTTRIDTLLTQALEEDRAANDWTTNLTVPRGLRASASVLARQEMIVCGLGIIPRFLELFAKLSAQPEAHRRYEIVSHPEIFDGVKVRDGQVLAVIRHNARTLLSCERSILNLMQHLSGIATETRRYVDAIADTGARLLDTRKTIPGLRALEKYAVACGGGSNHRMDLAAAILIKNNHIALGGGVATALRKALAERKPGQRVEVEVRTAAELEAALENGAEALLLDNMTPAQVKESVRKVQEFSASHNGRAISTEASGGIQLKNIRAYADTGVDFISVGALTHSSPAADISMRIEAEA